MSEVVGNSLTGEDALEIKRHLSKAVPALEPLLEGMNEIPLIRPGETTVPEAVVQTVVGQMLSRGAASAIHERLCRRAAELSSRQTWQLSSQDLQSCGLSWRKIRTIEQFASEYKQSPEPIDSWPEYSWNKLRVAVCQFWGMSEWTASILAIFHFGHEDVFPHRDGSIRRALAVLEARDGVKSETIQAATPYRSYAAMYLWAALDKRIL